MDIYDTYNEIIALGSKRIPTPYSTFNPKSNNPIELNNEYKERKFWGQRVIWRYLHLKRYNTLMRKFRDKSAYTLALKKVLKPYSKEIRKNYPKEIDPSIKPYTYTEKTMMEELNKFDGDIDREYMFNQWRNATTLEI